MLMSLDLSATLFGAYRVVLPALAIDVLDVGPAGYGVLSAAPSAGALLATYVVFRVVQRSRRLGRVLLVSTVLYGVSVVALAQAHVFALAIVAAALIGGMDAMATTIRHAPYSWRRRTRCADGSRRSTRCPRVEGRPWVTPSWVLLQPWSDRSSHSPQAGCWQQGTPGRCCSAAGKCAVTPGPSRQPGAGGHRARIDPANQR